MWRERFKELESKVKHILHIKDEKISKKKVALISEIILKNSVEFKMVWAST